MLKLIPLGTGSDFARTFNWKNNSLEAIERIGKGQRQKVDVGHVVLPSGGVDRYFINVADIHLSAKGGYYAAKYKKLGTFCYVAGALHGFASHKNQDFDIRIDDGEWQLFPKVTTMAVGNAKYYGGGMKITPTADPFSNDLEVVMLQKFKCVHTIEIRQHFVNLEVESKEKIFIQADGEHLGFLPAKFSILPGAIDFLV
ncbi:hypothetical protein O6H91_01G128200 [Diphasiastrum complanatum]|uniref:Uncharacterized protein n=1 Tax=Diphasiastrum complanatum TaxID=34168 RepID=A0ACC2EVW6_DIPCM|nr:hypothetical protein O6H91_01G128200 [Diphasiastrum complanatum]